MLGHPTYGRYLLTLYRKWNNTILLVDQNTRPRYIYEAKLTSVMTKPEIDAWDEIITDVPCDTSYDVMLLKPKLPVWVEKPVVQWIVVSFSEDLNFSGIMTFANL